MRVTFEKLVVATFALEFSKVHGLDPFFDENDKTPLTDGHIDVYPVNRTQSNAEMRGRVHVQIKSKSKRTKFVGRHFSYPIEIEALVGFQRLRTSVLYLVGRVYCSDGRSPEEVTLHYVVLSPALIRGILGKAKPAQQTSSVKLKPLPKENSQRYQIVDFVLRSQMEAGNLVSLSDLMASIEIEGFHVASEADLDWDAPIELDRSVQNFSIFAKSPVLGLIPIADELTIVPSTYIDQEHDVAISAGGQTYQTVSVKRLSKGRFQARLSAGLVIEFAEESSEEHGCVRFALKGRLPQVIQDLSFLISLVGGGRLDIAGSTFQMPFTDAADLEESLSLLDSLQKIDQVLRYFGAKSDLIEVEDVTNKQHGQLLDLHEMLFVTKNVDEYSDSARRIRQPIGRWFLDICYFPKGTDEEAMFFSTVDLPDHKVLVASNPDYQDGKPFVLTGHDLFLEDQHAHTLNLCLEKVVDSYDANRKLPETTALVKRQIQRLIDSADQEGERQGEFLETALALLLWLRGAEGEFDADCIRLDELQVAKRLRGLSPDERHELRQIRWRAYRSESPESKETALSASILLEDVDEALMLHSGLSDELKADYDKSGMGRLYRRLSN